MPDKWQYYQDIGFVYYWNVHDYRRGRRGLQARRRGAGCAVVDTVARGDHARQGRRPRAPRVCCGSRSTRRANNDFARNAARTKLQQLDAIETIERLQQAVDAVVSRSGGQVTDWGPLIRAGTIPGVPLDPAGVPYELSSSSRVELSPRSPLFPLPIEPGARSGA